MLRCLLISTLLSTAFPLWAQLYYTQWLFLCKSSCDEQECFIVVMVILATNTQRWQNEQAENKMKEFIEMFSWNISEYMKDFIHKIKRIWEYLCWRMHCLGSFCDCARNVCVRSGKNHLCFPKTGRENVVCWEDKM